MKIFKLLFFIFPAFYFSQIQYGGAPVYALNNAETPYISIDHSNLINNDLHPMILKYAHVYSTDIDFLQASTKITGQFETTLTLGIESAGAKAMGFFFDEFHLTDNTKMFIYLLRYLFHLRILRQRQVHLRN